MKKSILRFFAVGFDRIFIKKDAFANKMIDACNKRNIPITVNKYIWDPKKLQEKIDLIVQDGRFSGFILYETARYTKFGPKRDCSITMEEIKNLKIP